MNNVIIDNIKYNYEGYWRKSKDLYEYDINGRPFPFPISRKKWQHRAQFIEHLTYIESYNDKRGHFEKFEYDTQCMICNAPNIKQKLYKYDKILWDSSLLHYIKEHNVIPSKCFVEKIFQYQPNKRILSMKRHSKLHGVNIIKKNKKYLKVDRNQLLIMDALFEHGGKKIYGTDQPKPKYSEHTGLLDFNDDGLEKILISGKTTRVDIDDDEIFFPENMPDAYDYEYIFHTHPATPSVGGRVKEGILYEFPSISDIFHFIDHYNNGTTQGSIVIAAEGMYVIRKLIFDTKKIFIDEDKLYDGFMDVFEKIQRHAIKKYGTDFNEDIFFENIAQDTKYISKLNSHLNNFELHIDYFYRIKFDNKWILDTVYLPVFVVESNINSRNKKQK